MLDSTEVSAQCCHCPVTSEPPPLPCRPNPSLLIMQLMMAVVCKLDDCVTAVGGCAVMSERTGCTTGDWAHTFLGSSSTECQCGGGDVTQPSHLCSACQDVPDPFTQGETEVDSTQLNGQLA